MDEIIHSQDGSHTILSNKFGVSYHSKYGAIQETETVFINAGLAYAKSQNLSTISILEMGFGTGLNAIMTFLASDSIDIDYHTIEAYPIPTKLYSALNYPEILRMTPLEKTIFFQMHNSFSEQKLSLSSTFTFTKYLQKLEAYESSAKFDLIYFDAFAPSSQEELWTEEIMKKLYDLCNPNAALVTYCAKGSFKRALRSAGFTVEGLPGPIGKREMTRAVKK